MKREKDAVLVPEDHVPALATDPEPGFHPLLHGRTGGEPQNTGTIGFPESLREPRPGGMVIGDKDEDVPALPQVVRYDPVVVRQPFFDGIDEKGLFPLDLPQPRGSRGGRGKGFSRKGLAKTECPLPVQLQESRPAESPDGLPEGQTVHFGEAGGLDGEEAFEVSRGGEGVFERDPCGRDIE